MLEKETELNIQTNANRKTGTLDLFMRIDNISSPCPSHVISGERMSSEITEVMVTCSVTRVTSENDCSLCLWLDVMFILTVY